MTLSGTQRTVPKVYIALATHFSIVLCVLSVVL